MQPTPTKTGGKEPDVKKSTTEVPDSKAPTSKGPVSTTPVSKASSAKNPATDENPKPVDYIRFDFGENKETGSVRAWREKKILETLGSAKFWTCTGYTNVGYRGFRQLRLEGQQRGNPLRALSILHRLGFTVRYEDNKLVALKTSKRSLSAILDMIEASHTSDELKWNDEWEIVEKDEDIEPWVVVAPK